MIDFQFEVDISWIQVGYFGSFVSVYLFRLHSCFGWFYNKALFESLNNLNSYYLELKIYILISVSLSNITIYKGLNGLNIFLVNGTNVLYLYHKTTPICSTKCLQYMLYPCKEIHNDYYLFPPPLTNCSYIFITNCLQLMLYSCTKDTIIIFFNCLNSNLLELCDC